MVAVDVYERVITEVCTLDRDTMIERLAHFEGRIPLDFSYDFLQNCDTEKLRHLLAAALWRSESGRN